MPNFNILKNIPLESLVSRIFVSVFVIGMIVYGSTKAPSNASPSMSQLPFRSVAVTDGFEPPCPSNEYLRIEDFLISRENKEVEFELSWSDDLFDYVNSRNVDLYMSTNLLSRHWSHINNFYMPYATNRHVLTVNEYDVSFDAREYFTNSFENCAFFTFGLDVDSDGDGLNDSFEKYVIGSSPNLPDSDFDGLDDLMEFDIGTDPCNPDSDGDGIPDEEEFQLYHSNPLSADSDGDGLSDADEIGRMVITNSLSWTALSANVLDVTPEFSDRDCSLVNSTLPRPIVACGETFTNILIDVNGIIYLPRKGLLENLEASDYFDLAGNDCRNALVLMPYNRDLYLTTTEPASRVTIGESFIGTNQAFVVQYENVCPYKNRNRSEETNSLSFQVVIPYNGNDPIHFLYKDITGDGMNTSRANVGVQSVGGLRSHVISLTESSASMTSGMNANDNPAGLIVHHGWLYNGLDLILYPGFGTNPTKIDTDSDGISDGNEVSLSLSPVFSDTDGDGMNDGWELKHEGFDFDPCQDNSKDSNPDNDADADPDNDGLDNEAESNAGTDPYSSDSDDDGISDSDEVTSGTDPNDATDTIPVRWVSLTGRGAAGEIIRHDETVTLPAGVTACIGVFVFSEEYPRYTDRQSEYNDRVVWSISAPGNPYMDGFIYVNNEDGAWDRADANGNFVFRYSPVVLKDAAVYTAPVDSNLSVSVSLSAMNVADDRLPTTVIVGMFPLKIIQSNAPASTGIAGTTDAATSYSRVNIPKNGVAYITSHPSPPQLTAQFKGLPNFMSVTWSGNLTSERADCRDAIDDRTITPKTVSGENTFNITAALNNEIVGGTCNLNAGINGRTGNYSFRIRGKNPLDATARGHIDSTVDNDFRPYAWMIAKHESKSGNRIYNQFNPAGNMAGLPNKGAGYGWGMCQIDKGRTGTATAEVYDWHQNVSSMNAKLTSALADYNRFVGYYRTMYANNPDVQWVEPDNVTTQMSGYAVSPKMWSVLTFYNGAEGCPRRMLNGRNRLVPLEFIPSTSTWVLHPNVNDYVQRVLSDRNQTETE